MDKSVRNYWNDPNHGLRLLARLRSQAQAEERDVKARHGNMKNLRDVLIGGSILGTPPLRLGIKEYRDLIIKTGKEGSIPPPRFPLCQPMTPGEARRLLERVLERELPPVMMPSVHPQPLEPLQPARFVLVNLTGDPKEGEANAGN